MVQRVEALRDIALYEPLGSYPRAVDLSQRGVTTPVWSEAMGGRIELRLVVLLCQIAYPTPLYSLSCCLR
jgi:hypothetical protein